MRRATHVAPLRRLLVRRLSDGRDAGREVADELKLGVDEGRVGSFFSLGATERLKDGMPKSIKHDHEVSKKDSVLYRKITEDLLLHIHPGKSLNVMLEGPVGCGKSVLLGTAVSWFRAKGGLALYVDTAKDLVTGGTYKKDGSGMWDTPEVAAHVLQRFRTAHGEELVEKLPSCHERLEELIAQGIDGSQNPVDCLLHAMQELREQRDTPVMFAVDDYNALYGRSDYYQAIGAHKLKMILPGQLRVASSFRLMESLPTPNCVVLCATSAHAGVAKGLKLPIQGGYILPVPLLSQAEMDLCLQYYSRNNILHMDLDDREGLQKLFVLVDGNGFELKKRCMSP